MRTLLCVAVVACLCFADSADARYRSSYRRYGYGSNTMSDLIRAQGQYEVMHQQAVLQGLEIQRQAMQNRVAAAQTYLQLREYNKQIVESIHPTAHGDKYVPPAEHHAASFKRLTTTQLDPVTGEIHWNPVLEAEEFALDRRRIQSLFTQRAEHHGGVGPQAEAEVHSAADDMEAELRKQVDGLKPQEYIDARRFIDSLVNEICHPG